MEEKHQTSYKTPSPQHIYAITASLKTGRKQERYPKVSRAAAPHQCKWVLPAGISTICRHMAPLEGPKQHSQMGQ